MKRRADANQFSSQLQNLLEYDDQRTIIDLLDAARSSCKGIYELKHYRQQLDLDPQVLQTIEQRLQRSTHIENFA